MSTSTVRAISSIPSSQLRDDLESALVANGFSLTDVTRFEKQLAYRKAYNERPEVRERRRAYTAKRNAKMKALKALLGSME